MGRAKLCPSSLVLAAICALFLPPAEGMELPRTNLKALTSPAGMSSIKVPPGFAVTLFASGLDGPRFIRFGPDGALYVAERGANRIVVLADRNHDGVAESSHVFADRLDRPHSIVFHQGAWYVGVPRGVLRLRDSNGDGIADHRETLIDHYPTGGH